MISIESIETLSAPKLPIWNKDAFDDGDFQVTSSIEASCSNFHHDFIIESLDSDCSKDYQIPVTTDPIRSGDVQEKPPKDSCEAPSTKSKSVKAKSGEDRDERDIDAEIEELEKEIGRVTTRLESLRLEKADQIARNIAIRGRIVPAKFMEPHKQIDDSTFPGSKSRTSRRGVSLGPREILSESKKSETVTPLQSAQNRRQSCFWKLPGIEECKVTKPRGRTSLSVSPRSRKAASKIRAATTVGSKRVVKKGEGILSSIQPKKLFKDNQNSVSSKQPLKPGRVVASRYSQMKKPQAEERDSMKLLLPENEEKENHHSLEKRRDSELKKNWEITSELELYSNDVKEVTPIGKKLPKIRTLRCAVESPRDSGAAKRVAELESKNRNFTFCQLLRFEE